MIRKLFAVLLALAIAVTSVVPAWAQEFPEPFCGDLDEEDCDLLRSSTEAMFTLQSYTTSVTYTLYQQGIPELPPESEAALRVEGYYAFDSASREAMRTLAVISREEPLAAVEAIGESPDLLIDLYDGMTADLTLTLDLSESWTRTLADEADVEWPELTNVQLRLVGGVLYFHIAELKPLIPELAETNDWVAIEVVDTLRDLAEEGALQSVAADVAASSQGRSVWGLEPAMLNLITSMRSAFGRPENLWPYMEIRRRRDVDLDEQAGAVFQTDFDALDFILSDEFRDVITQVLQVASAEEGAAMSESEINEIAGIFWFLAPSLFRDLEVSGTSTIGVDDGYQYVGKTVFDWDLTSLVQMIVAMEGDEFGQMADEIFITFTTEFENSAFNEEVTVEAPEDAEILPLEALEGEGLSEFN
jgi:hypothetical protein